MFRTILRKRAALQRSLDAFLHFRAGVSLYAFEADSFDDAVFVG